MQVPYKGLAPLVTGKLSNEIQVGFAAPTVVLQHLKSGSLRALAYSAAKPWSGMKESPTMEEIAPGFIYEAAWHGVFAAAATQKPIVSRLQSEIAKVIQQPKMRDFFDGGGYVSPVRAPQDLKTFLEKGLKTLTELFRLAKFKAE